MSEMRCGGHDEGMYEVSYCDGSCLNEPCDSCGAGRGEACVLLIACAEVTA